MVDVIDDYEQVQIEVIEPGVGLDLSQCEIVDPNGYLSIGSNAEGTPNRRVNFTNFPRNVNTYLKLSIEPIVGDFELIFKTNISMLERRLVQDNAGGFVAVGLTNADILNYAQITTNNGGAVYIREYSSPCYITQAQCEAAGCTWDGLRCNCDQVNCACEWFDGECIRPPVYIDAAKLHTANFGIGGVGWIGFLLNTDYWIRIKRTNLPGSTNWVLTQEVFTDAALTNRVASLTSPTQTTPATPITQFYPIIGRGASDALSATGYFETFQLNLM